MLDRALTSSSRLTVDAHAHHTDPGVVPAALLELLEAGRRAHAAVAVQRVQALAHVAPQVVGALRGGRRAMLLLVEALRTRCKTNKQTIQPNAVKEKACHQETGIASQKTLWFPFLFFFFCLYLLAATAQETATPFGGL